MIASKEIVCSAIREIAMRNSAVLALLFGSTARGTATGRSDVDVIFVERTREKFLNRIDKYYDFLVDRLGTAVDIMVYTPEEFAAMREGSFVGRALREGVVVYGSVEV
jgi:predicted nucleotidyltransferase